MHDKLINLFINENANRTENVLILLILTMLAKERLLVLRKHQLQCHIHKSNAMPCNETERVHIYCKCI